MKNCLLSICLPTYNRKMFLSQKIDFFLKETANTDEVEVLLIDNNSNDGTVEFLESIVDELPSNWRVIFNDSNIGAINNILKCYDLAIGCFVWTVGDDDVLETNVVSNIINILKSKSELNWVFLKHGFVKESVKYTRNWFDSLGGFYKKGKDLFDSIANKDCKVGPMMFMTANILHRNCIKEVLRIYRASSECKNNNMTVVLGVVFWAALNGSAYVSDEILLYDNVNISWGDKMLKVSCRDQLAILDMIAINTGRDLSDYINVEKNIGEHMEYRYFLGKHKENNYAMKYYLKHKPYIIVTDFFFWGIPRILTHCIKNVFAYSLKKEGKTDK